MNQKLTARSRPAATGGPLAAMKILFYILFAIAIFGKLNAQEIERQKTIGGIGHDDLQSIINTYDGGFMLGGSSRSPISGDKTENVIGINGEVDYWIVKIDSNLNVQWDNTIGGYFHDYLTSIANTTDGGYLVAGFSESNSGGDKTEGKIGWDDYWIVKTDSIGNVLWDNTIGGAQIDQLQDVIETTDGGFLIAGKSNSWISGDKTENPIGNIQNMDYWILKLNSIGNIVWQQTIGGSATDIPCSIIQTSDGGYLIGGTSDSDISGDKTENSKGGTDYWIVKIDSIGNILWQNTIGGNSIDNLSSIVQSSDGSYLIGGTSESGISGDKTEHTPDNYFHSDFWIVKLDTAGNILWQNTIGGNELDQLNSIVITNTWDYLIGGPSRSSISGDKTENVIGNITSPDYWIVQLTEKNNFIDGNIYVDLNKNLQYDSTEILLSHHNVIELNTNRIGFSTSKGKYRVAVLDTGHYSVSPLSLNYFIPKPSYHNATFTSILQTDSLNDFAFQPTVINNNLCVSITPTTPFRSGFNASYLVEYSNLGTTTVNGTVVFYPDTGVAFVSSTPAAALITPDSIVYSIGTLSPYETGQIVVTVNVNLGKPNGSLINSGATIFPIASDANPECNQAWWEVFITGSYDPNDILVNRDSMFTYEILTPPFLEYIIRFQNTGNDTAFNVNIINALDTNMLDLNSLEFVSASHPLEMQFIYYQKNIEFKFDNILLPDSNTNESMSHGFIRYIIKPKNTLLLGDSIINGAAIYFDYNEPVLTNKAITLIVKCNTYSSKSVHSCGPYISSNGQNIWSTSGTYTEIFSTPPGCDSIVTINLTIPVFNPNILIKRDRLISLSYAQFHQWLDCTHGYSIIENATDYNFVPKKNGYYAVVATDRICADTSACVEFLFFEDPYMLYPNPGINIVSVSVYDQKDATIKIELFGSDGNLIQKVYNGPINRTIWNMNLEIGDLSKGIYYFKFTGLQNRVLKFVKL